MSLASRFSKDPLGFAVIGAGRIGRLHAQHLAGSIEGAHLVAVADASKEAAEAAAFRGARATTDVGSVFADEEVDAVLIASPTDFHLEQIRLAIEHGKAIFCEKPVAHDLAGTEEAMREVRDAGLPFQIGFNRRFDPGFAELARTVRKRELGNPEIFRSQSSDPAVPAREYLGASGGVYLDSIIHDIDIARFVVGEIERVTAVGRVLVEPYLAEVGDVDTTIVTLEFGAPQGGPSASGNGASAPLGVIQYSRRTVYGYDLRVEVHCERGKVVTEAERATNVWKYDQEGIHADYVYYFLERFKDAYRDEVQEFVAAVQEGRDPEPGPRDAVESLRVAIAAGRSLREGRPVKVAEVE